MAEEREVVYRVKVVGDPANAGAFDSILKQHDSVLRQLQQRESALAAAERSRRDSPTAPRSQRNSEEAALEQSRRNAERALASAEAAYDRAINKSKLLTKTIGTQMSEAAEGVHRVARGVALLGFTSDENLEKLLKNLAVVQGIADTVLGTVKVYTSLTQAVEAYRGAVLAAGAAEAAGKIANRAAISYGIDRTLGGAISGAGAAGTAGTIGGSALAGGAGGAAGAASLMGSLGGIAALAAAVGGLTLAVNSMSESFHMAFMSGGEPKNGSEADSINSGWNAMMRRTYGNQDWINSYNAMQSANRAENNLDRNRQMMGRVDANRALSSANRTAIMNQRYGSILFNAGNASDATDQLSMLRGGLGDIRGDIALAGAEISNNSLGSNARVKAQEQFIALKEQELRFTQQIADVERSAIQKKLDGAREAYAENQRALDQFTRNRDDALGNLQSAKVRFGDMSPADRMAVIAAQKKANTRGAESLTPMERQRLRSLGLEESNAQADLASMAAADKFGFNDLFGSAERATADRAEKMRDQLAIDLRDEREIIVKLERDDEAIAKQFAEQARKIIDERDATMFKMMEELLKRDKSNLNNQNANKVSSANREAMFRFG